MLRLCCLFISFSLGLLSCNNNPPTSERVTVEGFVEEYQYNPETSMKNGISTIRTKEGILVENAHYEEGVMHGERTIYHANGNVHIHENYEFGEIQGSYEVYFEDGIQSVEGIFEGGSMEGEWLYYYPSGNLKEVVTFRGSEENGPFKEYFESGGLKATGNYKDGDYEHGLVIIYNEVGDTIQKLQCFTGICKTIWEKN